VDSCYLSGSLKIDLKVGFLGKLSNYIFLGKESLKDGDAILVEDVIPIPYLY